MQSCHQTTENLLNKKKLLKALRNLKLKCLMLHIWCLSRHKKFLILVYPSTLTEHQEMFLMQFHV